MGWCRASFETAASRPPQDERCSQMPSKTYLILRNARRACLEGRTTAMQPILSQLLSPYLLAAACYVDLNPVRAWLAERAHDWRWSSARAHLDERDDAPVRVAPLLAPAPDWAAFLARGLGAEEHAAIRAGERTGRPLGSASAPPSPAESPDPSRQATDPARGI